jgi:hypothetical protein
MIIVIIILIIIIIKYRPTVEPETKVTGILSFRGISLLGISYKIVSIHITPFVNLWIPW